MKTMNGIKTPTIRIPKKLRDLYVLHWPGAWDPNGKTGQLVRKLAEVAINRWSFMPEDDTDSIQITPHTETESAKYFYISRKDAVEAWGWLQAGTMPERDLLGWAQVQIAAPLEAHQGEF